MRLRIITGCNLKIDVIVSINISAGLSHRAFYLFKVFGKFSLVTRNAFTASSAGPFRQLRRWLNFSMDDKFSRAVICAV